MTAPPSAMRKQGQAFQQAYTGFPAPAPQVCTIYLVILIMEITREAENIEIVLGLLQNDCLGPVMSS